jgi:hypothetical protein
MREPAREQDQVTFLGQDAKAEGKQQSEKKGKRQWT